MKKNSLFLILLLVCNTIFAQEQLSKKQVRKLITEGQYHLDGEDYPRAWVAYKQVLRNDPNHEKSAVNAALSSYNLGYPTDSILFLEPNFLNSKLPDSKFYLARIRHHQKKFNEALSLLQTYSSIDNNKRNITNDQVSYWSGVCLNAKNFTSEPKKSVVKNMGPNINSRFPDYVPVIMPDESALYFTSKREGSSNNQKNGDNNYFEDVYVSYNVNGVWQKATNVGEPVNSETNDGCVAISPDGQRMIIYRTAANIETGDLYLTKAGINNKWESLQLLGKEINSEYIETSACFSNDSNEIYFSSNRPGGLGGKDLYRIKRLPNGNWSVPYNLGSTVNSKYDDDAPFLHPDGITLYYSSKGHNTMGEFDVFKSILNKENNEFSAAENLGYPINDISNDIFFVLSVDGQRGFYSSVKEQSLGGIDIYQVDTRFGENDLKVIRGFAFLEENPGRVKITLTDKETKEVNGVYYSNPTQGKFICIVNPLKSYDAVIEAEGYSNKHTEIKPLAMDEKERDLEFRLKK